MSKSSSFVSKSFALYHPNNNNSTITIGRAGFRIVYYYNTEWPMVPIYVFFANIRAVSEITTWIQEGYQSFKITCSTIDTPLKFNDYEIKMNKDIDEVYMLINDMYKNVCLRKDNMVGIL
jgi:hypothetical protein